MGWTCFGSEDAAINIHGSEDAAINIRGHKGYAVRNIDSDSEPEEDPFELDSSDTEYLMTKL